MLNVAENPLPLLLIFLGVAVAAGGMWYFVARHWLAATIASIACLAGVAVGIVAVAIVTDQEKVRHSIRELAAHVQQNDVVGVVAWISSSVPEIQQRAREEMALCQFAQCWVTQIDEVQFDAARHNARTDVILFCSGSHQVYDTGSALVYLRVALRLDPDGVWRLTDFSYTVQNGL